MKNFIKSTLVLCLILIISSCSKNESVNDKPDEVVNDSKYGVSLDASSPLIYSDFSEEGDVNFYGTKYEDGSTKSVDYISVQVSEFVDPLLIDVDKEGRVNSILSPNGASIKIEYINNTELKIKAVNENGDQVYFQTSLDNPIEEGNQINYLSKSRNNKQKINDSELFNLEVKLLIDGQPFNDADVKLRVQGIDENGNVTNYDPLYKAGKIENGIFYYNILEPDCNTISKLDNLCKSVEKAFGPLCDGVSILANPSVQVPYLCGQIGVAFNAAGIPAFGTCVVLTGALITYCDTLGSGGLKLLCKAIPNCLPSYPEVVKYRIEAFVHVKGGGIYHVNASKNQVISGPFEDIIFELPEDDLFRIFAGLYNGYWSGTTTQQSYFPNNPNQLITTDTGLWISIDKEGEVTYNFNDSSRFNVYGGGVIENNNFYGLLRKNYGVGTGEIIFQNTPIINSGGVYSLEINTIENYTGTVTGNQRSSVQKSFSLKKSIN